MKDKLGGFILGLIILILAILSVLAYKDKIEKIENGSFILTSDAEGE